MISSTIPILTKTTDERTAPKSIKVYPKHAMRFCKSKCDMCNFIKKRPLLKEAAFILPITWDIQNKEKPIKQYSSAKKLKHLLESYEILSTLNTDKEKWYHYVLSGIVSSYLNKHESLCDRRAEK